MRVLNCYAGIGGNRKLWQNVEVTAIEINEKVANVYKKLHPADTVIIGDAHEYLLKHFDQFDFIWTSPPCQTHTRLVKSFFGRKRVYPDMRLYQEIILLQHHFKGGYVVENVNPYYDTLIPARRCGRHLFWSNFHFSNFDVPSPKSLFNKNTKGAVKEIQEWLGIEFEETIYLDNHSPTQVLRNCVHPLIGKHIFDAFLAKKGVIIRSEGRQIEMF